MEQGAGQAAGNPFAGFPGGNPFGGFAAGDFSFSFGPGFGGAQAMDAEEVQAFLRNFGGFGPSFGRSRNRPRGTSIRTRIRLSFMEAANGTRRQFNVDKGNGVSETVNIDIPPGAETGTEFLMRGRGLPSPANAGKPGDMIVVVEVAEDARFTRNGLDVYTTAKVDFVDAILGATIRIPTLTGEMALRLNPGTQPNEEIRLKDSGILALHKQFRGDLLVRIDVEIPSQITPRQRQLLQDFHMDPDEADEPHGQPASRFGLW